VLEGLPKFCEKLEQWPEITRIRLGPLSHRNRVGRRSDKLRPKQGFETVHGIKRRRGGGGFSFRATRDAVIGSVVTGIKCDASNGTSMQEVVLSSDDLPALWARLKHEGFA
jgi:hypothetical protein